VPQAYSKDLRKRLIRLVESGTSARAAAKVFSVSESTAIKWTKRWRAEKSIAPSPVRGHRRALLADRTDQLLKLVENNADLTLEEVRTHLRRSGVHVSLWTIWNFFKQRRVSLKKKRGRA
jgi:putative transposase